MFKIQVEIRILSVNPNHVILNYSMTNRTDKVLELTVVSIEFRTLHKAIVWLQATLYEI